MMRLRDFWCLCTVLLASNAQVITITTHIGACAASYSSISTTTVAATVTIKSTPWTDAIANDGTPFVIRLQQVDLSGYPSQSTAPYWLMANGNTTTDASAATIYRIVDSQLMTYNGSYISTNSGVVDQTFAISPGLGSIATRFSVDNHMLNWTNAQFSNGKAQFYKLPPGLLDNAQILAKFLGSMEPQRSWSPVILYVDPVPQSIQAPSVISSTYSGLTADSENTASAYSGPGGVSPISKSTQSLLTTIPGTVASASGPTVLITASSSLSSPVIGSDTGYVASTSRLTEAAPPISGISSSTNSLTLGTGGSSTSLSSPTSSFKITPSISISDTISAAQLGSASPISSSNLSASAPSSPTCSAGTITDTSGAIYAVHCSSDTTAATIETVNTANGVQGCLTACDEYPGCVAATFTGTDDTNALVGSCHLRATVGTIEDSEGNTVVLVLVASPSSSMLYSSTVYTTSASAPVSLSLSGGPGPVSQQSVSSSSSTATSFSSSHSPSSAATSVGSSLSLFSPSSYSSSSSPSTSSPSTSSLLSSTATRSPASSSSTSASASLIVTSSSLVTGASPSISPSSSSSSLSPLSSSISMSSVTSPGTSSSSSSPITLSSTSSISSVSIMLPSTSSSSSVSDPSTSRSIGSASIGTSSSTLTASSSPVSSLSTTSTSSSHSLSSTISSTSSSSALSSTMSTTSSSSISSLSTSSTSSNHSLSSTISSTSFGSVSSSTMPTTSFSSIPSSVMSTISSSSVSSSTMSTPSSSTTLATSSSSTLSSPISTTSVSTTVGSSGSATSTTSAPTYSSTYTCSGSVGQNSTFLTDAQGNTYQIFFGGDTSSATASNGISYVTNGNFGCMNACDAYTGCIGFTFSTNAAGLNGYCYLRTTLNTCISSLNGPYVDLGVLVATGGPISTSSSSSLSSATSTTSTTSASSSKGLSTGSAIASNTINVIPSPTLCSFGDPPGTEEDDNYCEIDLPFQVQLYDNSDSHTYASTNGFLSITYGSAAYAAVSLPNTYLLPNSSACPFFDDLYLYPSRPDGEGIFYSYNATTVYYEWILSRGNTTEYYHFTAFYDTARPGVWVYRYYATGGSGAGENGGVASVGIQGVRAGVEVAAQFSYDSPVVVVGLSVVCDTTSGVNGTCVAG